MRGQRTTDHGPYTAATVKANPTRTDGLTDRETRRHTIFFKDPRTTAGPPAAGGPRRPDRRRTDSDRPYLARRTTSDVVRRPEDSSIARRL